MSETTSLPLPEWYTAQRRAAMERRLEHLVELLGQGRRYLILTHNDPDPDAISSALGVQALIRHLVPQVRTTLAHGGMIGRSENRRMVELFAPRIKHIPLAKARRVLAQYRGVALVDTQPSAGNHLLYALDYPLERVFLVIDHHPPRRSQFRAVIHDVRPEVGATATLVTEYLAAAEAPVDRRLATALFYGIKADTRGLSRHTSELDVWAYTTLRTRLDDGLLSQIEQVRLPRSYFRSLSHALANTKLYPCHQNPPQEDEPDEEKAVQPCQGYVAVCMLPEMERPDMAAEIADLLMRLEGVSWAICLGIYDARLIVSVRTDLPGARAGRLLRTLMGRNGTAGGHDTMAGGRIALNDATPAERIAAMHALVPRFLAELGVGNEAGIPLLERVGTE